jgi:hypothetical protein
MLELIARIPEDKLRHYMVGSIAAALGGLHSVAAGAMLCAAVAIGKEVYDRVSKRGTPDLMDAVWTLAGGAVVVVPLAVWRSGALL